MPKSPGVYLFLDKGSKVIYVGKALNLKKRVSCYFQNKNLEAKTSLLVSKIGKIRTITVSSEIEAFLLEANLIKKYRPFFNTRLADGKLYPLIKITVNDDLPKVLIVRRKDDQNSVYFGPFPRAKSLRLVLRVIRRIFPYQSTINHPKKNCLYHHLGLCPCPPLLDKNGKLEYRKSIRHLVQFLSGEVKLVLKELEKERDDLSQKENFEKALSVQKKVEAIKLITAPFYHPQEYELNPNLEIDLRKKELNNLGEVLKENNVKFGKISKIECFDVSNISGRYAVGSMVVFINGEKEQSCYRRFKIKQKLLRQNDPAMIAEVIERRTNHLEWSFPDLILVDGGKGQVSSALRELEKRKIKIPVIGLAKREEIMITSDFKEIRLPKNSGAFHLIVRIRDEAHRFALWYHKKLRSKAIFV